MYAVFKTGGKQYRVTKGDKFKIEKLGLEVGSSISFNEVMLLGVGEDVKIGEPLLAGAKVEAKVVSIGRADKIRIVKFRRRKHHRKQMGHRQHYSEIEITAISG
jgi:large subunit ribosomal protein L21